MSKIKSVSQFEDNIWGEATPIGADASNIDVEMSDSSTKDLQTVLGDIPSAAAPIQSQINTKVTASGGNIGNTTVSSGIQNFDSSSSETSTELLDTSVRVTNATEVTSSMWTKFNRFRKRVDNKFKDVFLSSVEDVASPSLTKTYSQSALNDYFANVVGYATAADLPDASSTIASQLSTLNNNFVGNSITFKGVNGTTPTISAWYLGMIVYICGYINNISTSANSEKIIASVEHYNTIPYPRTVIRVPGRYGTAYQPGTNCYIAVISRDGRIDIVMTTSTNTSNVQAYFGSIVYYGSIA